MHAVSLRGVSKTYGDVAALTDVSFEVDEGEVVALLGPNGSGESTLFELMLGLIEPTTGSLRVLGEAPGGEVRQRVGAMLQDGGLPGQVTVAELVHLVGRSYPSMLPVDEVLARTGLSGRRDRRIGALSGGERQRTSLAAATIAAPALRRASTSMAEVGSSRRAAASGRTPRAASATGRPSSSRPTTCARPRPSPTGSCSSARDGSSPTAHPPSSSPTPGPTISRTPTST